MNNRNDWSKDMKIRVIPKKNKKTFDEILYSEDVKNIVVRILQDLN